MENRQIIEVGTVTRTVFLGTDENGDITMRIGEASEPLEEEHINEFPVLPFDEVLMERIIRVGRVYRTVILGTDGN